MFTGNGINGNGIGTLEINFKEFIISSSYLSISCCTFSNPDFKNSLTWSSSTLSNNSAIFSKRKGLKEVFGSADLGFQFFSSILHLFLMPFAVFSINIDIPCETKGADIKTDAMPNKDEIIFNAVLSVFPPYKNCFNLLKSGDNPFSLNGTLIPNSFKAGLLGLYLFLFFNNLIFTSLIFFLRVIIFSRYSFTSSSLLSKISLSLVVTSFLLPSSKSWPWYFKS